MRERTQLDHAIQSYRSLENGLRDNSIGTWIGMRKRRRAIKSSVTER